MSLLYLFKPRKDRYLSTITTLLDGAGVTANEVTALGLCLALGAGLLAYYGHLYVGMILFATSAMCDAVDGSLARVSKIGTDFGLYFDGVADRFSELFFISGAVLGAQVPSSAFVVVGGSFALLLTRIYGYAHHWGAVSTTFGRPERLVLLVAGVLCPAPINTLLFIVAGLFCVFSSVQILARGITVHNERREGELQRGF